jgi:hypothetical protein
LTDHLEPSAPAFSPDGNEVFWSLWRRPLSEAVRKNKMMDAFIMNARKTSTLGWMILFTSLTGLAADKTAAPPYMGQAPPGFVPKLFAPDVPSGIKRSLCLTQDGRECYFNAPATAPRSSQIMVTRYEQGAWTPPVRAPFSDETSYGPALADNDRTLYFNRGRFTIWRVRRSSAEAGVAAWSEPEIMPAPVNTAPDAANNVSCKISSLGNMWICSWRPGGLGQCDIWRLHGSDGQFSEPATPTILNSRGSDCTAVPGPDEQYVVLRTNARGGFGQGDLFISFADGSGGWTTPRNLGPTINTANWEDAPYLSPDNKYLFFTRSSEQGGNLYWVSVGAFLPDPNGPISNLTTGRRFACIQAAVNYAEAGQVIQLSPGTYHENLILPDVPLTIRSANSLDPAVVARTILSGDQGSPVVKLVPGTALRSIQGLTITGGEDDPAAFGARLQVSACVIKGRPGTAVDVGADGGTPEASPTMAETK